MRVLGVDPGTRITGWGLVEAQGTKRRGLDAGLLRTDAKAALVDRLAQVHRGLVEVIARSQPDVVAVEDIFFARYANAALKLGHVRGVVLLAASQAGLPVAAYSPAVIKRTVAGRGRADKHQVAQFVGAMLGWRELPALDATDALAVALTHLGAQAYQQSAPALPRAKTAARPRRVRG